MTDQEILKDAPEDSTIVFNALLIDKSLIESMGKTLRLMQPRSLTDIRRIVELEKERDRLHDQVMVLTHTKEFDYVDDPRFVTNFNNIDIAFQSYSLEQQAKGLADYVSKVMDSSYILHLDPKNTNHCILINLNAAALRLLDRAQALKMQVKP